LDSPNWHMPSPNCPTTFQSPSPPSKSSPTPPVSSLCPNIPLIPPKKPYWISTHLQTHCTHQDHFRGPPEHSSYCQEVDTTGQYRVSAGPQVMENPLEFVWRCTWKHSVFSAPCVSFWEGGTCNRVAWGFRASNSID
jgi:hypothetical protein